MKLPIDRWLLLFLPIIEFDGLIWLVRNQASPLFTGLLYAAVCREN